MHISLSYYGAYTAESIWMHFARYTDQSKMKPEEFCQYLQKLGFVKPIKHSTKEKILWKPIKELAKLPKS